MTSNRIFWVDYLKVFACLLVVLGHFNQAMNSANIINSGYINIINFYIYTFHMPLFMCISGYLYYKRKDNYTNYKKFIKNKIINFIVPYLFFYIIYMLLNTIFSSSVNTAQGFKGWIGIFNMPIAPYWFLYALLSIFIVIPLFEKIIKDKKILFLLLCVLKVISIFFSIKIVFIHYIFSWGIYFYCGSFINDNKNNFAFIIIGILSNILIGYFLYNIQDKLYAYDLLSIFMALASIYVYVEIFKYSKKNKILSFLSKYTFHIFLMHAIFAAAVRILLLKFNVTSFIIHFIGGIIGGIIIPIIIGIVSEKIIYTDIVFYPINTINKIKKGGQKVWQKKN